jgi:hypothetical protein
MLHMFVMTHCNSTLFYYYCTLPWVAASRSKPNWAKATTSRYYANSTFKLPHTYFIAFNWAVEPRK